MMMSTGMLGEGRPSPPSPLTLELTLPIDGIHIDMNHLKKGEVK